MVGVGWARHLNLNRPQLTPNQRMIGIVKTPCPYFDNAESISGLGLAEIQRFEVALG